MPRGFGWHAHDVSCGERALELRIVSFCLLGRAVLQPVSGQEIKVRHGMLASGSLLDHGLPSGAATIDLQ